MVSSEPQAASRHPHRPVPTPATLWWLKYLQAAADVYKEVMVLAPAADKNDHAALSRGDLYNANGFAHKKTLSYPPPFGTLTAHPVLGR